MAKRWTNTTRSLFFLLVTSALGLTGCIGPTALHRAVLGYDDTVSRLESELLLLNIARLSHYLPDHYTVATSIAATFDYRTNVGFTGTFPGFENPMAGTNMFRFNWGAAASENPTMSIIPVSGEDFTKRILTPMRAEKLGFLIFQGASVDLVTRLMADGIEVQKRDGSFERFILNKPSIKEEYREFRQRAMHLDWLNENRQLFVGRIPYEKAVRAQLASGLSASDVVQAAEKGYGWRRLGGNEYELTKDTRGHVVITNYDVRTLSNTERVKLDALADANPENFVLVDIRPGYPGGDWPLFGALKLRSFNLMLFFLAAGIDLDREYKVEPHPETGKIKKIPPITLDPRRVPTFHPIHTLKVNATDTKPDTYPVIGFRGKYYSVPNTAWDRSAFFLLSKLFQMTVTDVSAVGIPVTISK